ncbi:MAG TPA: hypothetical protein PK208_09035 [Fibrobacteria bacterium]|nr:hypothetical protein [Fibrobacteria bacterium]
MSFFCPHQDATQEICHRLGGLKCRPGMAGCAMFGKVTRLEDEEKKPKARRKKESSAKPQDQG